jgi:hypothetical protein
MSKIDAKHVADAPRSSRRIIGFCAISPFLSGELAKLFSSFHSNTTERRGSKRRGKKKEKRRRENE